MVVRLDWGRNGVDPNVPSLNLDIDYFTSPATERLVRLLGKGSEVLPLKLKAYTAHHFVINGRLTGMTAQEIEQKCGWWGSSGKMVKAMLDGDEDIPPFLDFDGETYSVHGWIEEQGHLWAFKKRAKRANDMRWKKLAGSETLSLGNPSSNPTSIPSKSPPTKPTKPISLNGEKEKSFAERFKEPP